MVTEPILNTIYGTRMYHFNLFETYHLQQNRKKTGDDGKKKWDPDREFNHHMPIMQNTKPRLTIGYPIIQLNYKC